MAFFSPEQQYFYDILVEYYDNPTLYKIKDDENISVFGIRVPSLLLNENHYLICTSLFQPKIRKTPLIWWRVFT